MVFVPSEAVVRRCSVKKLFLKISQNSLEKLRCQSPFLDKVAGLGALLVAASIPLTHFMPLENLWYEMS